MSLVLNADWSVPAPQPVELPDGQDAEAPASPLGRVVRAWRRKGAIGFAVSAVGKLSQAVVGRWNAIVQKPIDFWIAKASAQPSKKVLKTNLSRDKLVQAFLTADLFVFASRIEYSPLVLFEAAAAGTPFVTVPVGNAEEIVRWTGSGVLCPARRDARGRTWVKPARLARAIERVVADEPLRMRLAAAGREAWRSRFNWASIARQYEAILTGRVAAASDGRVCMLDGTTAGEA
jgi:glycosyltransferase involved in cell wall biosynthesis